MRRKQEHNTELLLKSKYTGCFLRQTQSPPSKFKPPETSVQYVLQVHASAAAANKIQPANSFHCSFSPHIPPSVVLLWIHMVTGEAPNSLLQETLMLYHVMACSPGTSHWNGGTVTLMNRVVVTSPFLRLTSLTLDGTEIT